MKTLVEIDDETHQGAQEQLDGERNAALRSGGWEIHRPRTAESDQWSTMARWLADEISQAISPEALDAAARYRTLPPEHQRAISTLVAWPLAEAQITAVLAAYIGETGCAELSVIDQQNVDLAPVLEAVTQTLEQVANLHGVRNLGSPSLEQEGETVPNLRYFSRPAREAWEGIRRSVDIVVAPRRVSPDYVEPLTSAKPHPVVLDLTAPREHVEGCLRHYLQNIFRKVEFRGGQIDIILRALSLRPVVGLLPTAAGKSLCYQLVSLLQPGFTLVVDPLRSLMLDQQENLESMGIHRSLAIMSGMEATEIEDRLFRERGYRSIELGHQLFVFVAPERLQMPEFRDHVKSFVANVPIPFCVVDEAHCVSEWGHDFRPSYLNVGRLVREYCVHDGVSPSLLALTGTASRNVITDIMRELEINDPDSVIEPRSFDRQELEFEVCRTNAEGRMATLAGKLRAVLGDFGWRPGQPGEIPSGLIFAYFVNDPSIGVPRLVEELSTRVKVPIGLYCGKKPFGMQMNKLDWEQRKVETQRRFKRDEAPILGCTSAFGMGIDKPNIRFTIHAMLPRSLEEFYQQAGRAGRDGRPSRCLIVFADDQPELADEVLDTEATPLEEISGLRDRVPRDEQGDAIRNTWFMTNSFIGRDAEKSVLEYVVGNILLPHIPHHPDDVVKCEVSFTALPDQLLGLTRKNRDREEKKLTALERALYRLFMVKAVADYMKDYTRRKFVVKVAPREPSFIQCGLAEYLRRYAIEGDIPLFSPNPEALRSFEAAAIECGKALIDYVYATIEKRRRRAIGEMLLVARETSEAGGQIFRQRLLEYLEESEFTKDIVELVRRINPGEWFELLSRVDRVDAVNKLLGGCRRQLEESPSHPGLLLIAGLCRVASANPQQAAIDLRGGMVALRRYYPKPENRLWVASKVAEHAERLAPSRFDIVLNAILEGDSSRLLARFVYERASGQSDAHLSSVVVLGQHILESIQGERVPL